MTADRRQLVQQVAGLPPRAAVAIENLQRAVMELQDRLDAVAAPLPQKVRWEPAADGPMFDADGIWQGPVLGNGQYLGSAGIVHWFEVPLGSMPAGAGRVTVTDVGLNTGGAAPFDGREIAAVSGWGMVCTRAVTITTGGQLQRHPGMPVLHLAIAVRPGPGVAQLLIALVDMIVA